jgi:hypothetical protein
MTTPAPASAARWMRAVCRTGTPPTVARRPKSDRATPARPTQSGRSTPRRPGRCSAEGVWQSAGTACPYLCAAGLCAGECLPGGYRCVGATRQRCDASGEWTDYLACPFVCATGDCAGECVPGRSRCVAGELMTCSAAGAWQTVGTASRELLTNPGFDDADLIWTNPGVRLVYLANGSGANNTPEVAAQSPG